MYKLISILKELSAQHDIKNYHWDIPKNCPIQIPDYLSSNFDRNVYLKEHFNKALNKGDCLPGYYWIIQEWGGISSFKRNELNDAKILKFLKDLEEKSLTKVSFDRISSFSKVASFIQPSEYVIYDSRVIYSLNWLLFNYAPEWELFSQPQSRNSELMKYDMQTIFRLTGKSPKYRSHKNAYNEYCELIKMLSKEIYGQGGKPYLLEMLLFTVAPNAIVEDIQKKVSLKIDLELTV